MPKFISQGPSVPTTSVVSIVVDGVAKSIGRTEVVEVPTITPELAKLILEQTLVEVTQQHYDDYVSSLRDLVIHIGNRSLKISGGSTFSYQGEFGVISLDEESIGFYGQFGLLSIKVKTILELNMVSTEYTLAVEILPTLNNLVSESGNSLSASIYTMPADSNSYADPNVTDKQPLLVIFSGNVIDQSRFTNAGGVVILNDSTISANEQVLTIYR